MERYINNNDDLYAMLDSFSAGADWEGMYRDRKRQTPFIVQNEMPDENLAEFMSDDKNGLHKAIEFGCGEGRNAIFMAEHGLRVTGYDLSESAIRNARKIAEAKQVTVEFKAENALIADIKSDSVNFVYDSGMFHHLAPHRRIEYFELVRRILKKDMFFGLTCFAAGANAAPEVDDWDYYKEGRFGVAFTEQRLIDFWGRMGDVVYIRRYRDGIPGTLQGLSSMWVCLFRKR